MDEPGYLSPARAGEGTGRIQPDGAGLQFHPRGEHRGRRDPPQSGVKEAGRLPAGHPRGYTLHPTGAGGLSCERPEMATTLRDLITVKCHSPKRFRTVWTVCDTAAQHPELRADV